MQGIYLEETGPVRELMKEAMVLQICWSLNVIVFKIMILAILYLVNFLPLPNQRSQLLQKIHNYQEKLDTVV